MKKRILLGLLLVLTIPSYGYSADLFKAEEKTEIEKIVTDYLMEKPEIIVSALQEMERRMIAEEAKASKEALKEYAEELKSGDLIIGNPKGKTTVVEFFDYNCGYCKATFKVFVQAIEQNPDLKIVLRELPSLSPMSEELSRIAIAAGKQGKYSDMHIKLMTHKGQLNKAVGMKLAEELGLDMDKLKLDIASEETTKLLARNREIANKIGGRAVPTLVVADEVVMGAISLDELNNKLKK